MFKAISLKALAAAAVLALTAGVVNANTITCNFVTGNPSQTTEYNLVLSGAAACGTSGNDSAAALGAIPGVFAAPPAWTAGSLVTLSGPVNGTQSGSWAINAFPELTQIALVLKAGNNFAAFLLSPFTTSGTWSTDRNLSHSAVYYRTCKEGEQGCGKIVMPPVPLPAAGFLLLGALGGLGLAARRRRAAA